MNRKGFTLVEVMVVVMIVATLAAISIPSFKRAHERDKKRLKMVKMMEITKTNNIYITNIVTMTITRTLTNYVDVLKSDSVSKYESMEFRIAE